MGVGLVFFHGWGLDATFWKPLAEHLPAYPRVFFDAGYFGSAVTPACTDEYRWVAVGHSLGFARALQAPPAGGWAGLVSIAGFSRFCASLPGSPGQPRRVVERMLRALVQQPRAALGDFLARCNLPDLAPRDDVRLDQARLTADLALLLDLDVSAHVAALEVPMLALAARDDAIVSVQVTESTFAGCPTTQLVWSEQGGHALGYARASDCAVHIRQFLAAV